MNIFEIIATKRSGHHAIISWMVKNLTGMNLSLHKKDQDGNELNFKTEYVNKKVSHWNDANNDQQFGLKLFDGFAGNTIVQNLIVNYEDVLSDYSFFFKDEKFSGTLSEDRFDNIKISNTNRLLIIRDFYNCISSRYKQNMDGIFPHNYSTEFINLWKENAKFAIQNPKFYIKYEEWISNREYRNDFLFRYFNTYETFGPETIEGRKSSFDQGGYNERYLQVTLPDAVKKIINQDNELHYLLGKLGYEYKKV